jgi:hypothetical protein
MSISTLRVHELEAAIDAAKKRKADMAAALASKTPALPGPKGPREIPVEEVESGDVAIRVPQAPKKQIVKAPTVIKTKEKKVAKEVTEDKEDEGPVSPLVPVRKQKKVTIAPSVEPTKSAPTHYCNCPSCPLVLNKSK